MIYLLLFLITHPLETGGELMFAMDIPYIPAETPTTLVAQAAPSIDIENMITSGTQKFDYLFKTCVETEHSRDPRSAMRGVDPAGMLWIYYQHHNRDINLAAIQTKLLEGPKHGRLGTAVDNTGLKSYYYDPNPGFLGDDQVTFQAEYGSKRYKIVLTLKVMKTVVEMENVPSTCPPAKLIKVNSSSTSNGLDSPQVKVNLANLDNGTLGQTTAQSITLDPTAAGHGWFIDYTPYLNEEFLPTSNPYVWKAKPGSEAEGKMDMLSVLWHELGHAQGLDHTTDGQGLMSTTLAPGMRKLPTPEELAVLNSLNPPQSPFVKGGSDSGGLVAKGEGDGSGFIVKVGSDSSDLVDTATSLLPPL